MNFSDLIPKEGLNLVKYNKYKLIDRLGLEVIRNVVTSVLTGNNVRDITEGLTQRRILLLASSLIVTYLRAMNTFDNVEDLTDIIRKNTYKKLSEAQKVYLFWFLGMTGKSIQNVLRDNEGLDNYFNTFDENLSSIAGEIKNIYGDIEFDVKSQEGRFLLKWPNLLRCLLAVGSQTLTTRGSEKSLYGKMFEKFVMGSVLTLLGFEYIDMNDTSRSEKVFWLSEREDKREADATLLIKPGMGVRFDIGFIGRGNTEVSLDKVSRFERVMERDGLTNYTSTVILVDTIGENSRIVDMANNIGGHILQMSATYWVYELGQLLKETCGYRCNISEMPKDATLEYIRSEMRNINIGLFQETTSTSMKKRKKKK